MSFIHGIWHGWPRLDWMSGCFAVVLVRFSSPLRLFTYLYIPLLLFAFSVVHSCFSPRISEGSSSQFDCLQWLS
ncbi:hypothetical protein BDW71DRAFT_184642 [Aspergillus fruticulosus]